MVQISVDSDGDFVPVPFVGECNLTNGPCQAGVRMRFDK